MSENQGKGRVTLKEYFEADKIPREGHFADLIDAGLNKIDDQLFVNIQGEAENSARFLGIGSTDPQSPLSIRNRTGDAKLIGFENSGGSEEWHISINPDGIANGLMLINNSNPNTIVMVEADGNVGIGSQNPEEQLHVNGMLRLEQGVAVNEISNSNTLNENSQEIIPTQQAVKEYVDNLLVGSVSAFAVETPPEGWMECNGQAISREFYDRLFNKIGTAFGSGNGATTFNLPDLRGEFIRGWDHGRNIDTGRAFGSGQEDRFQSHSHNDTGHVHSDAGHTHWYGDLHSPHIDHHYALWPVGPMPSTGIVDTGRYTATAHANIQAGHANISDPAPSSAGAVRHGSETRPTNLALLYCIKF